MTILPSFLSTTYQGSPFFQFLLTSSSLPSELSLAPSFWVCLLTVWTSLVQWIRIHLPTQGTWVRPLIWEDSTRTGATSPTHHNYWNHALEPASCNKPECLELVLPNKRSHCNEKPKNYTWRKVQAKQWRPNASKKKFLPVKIRLF